MVDGRVPAGKYHKLACARHLRDREREHTPEFPYRFDLAKAERYFRFAEKLKHYKGEWAGQFIRLQPHQKFRKGCKYGWVHVATGLRRFRNSYEEIPRKNGKSLEIAIETLYLTFFDGEGGADGYCAATKREQALIIFGDCKQLVASSGLKDRLEVRVSNINHAASKSKLEPLSADYNSMDGLNVHVVSIDELHAHKTRGVIDVLETATGARRQPFINKITTAGDDPVSPCGDEHDYACKILERTLVDETYFGFIAHADVSDDWTLPATAAKANPNYGVSVNPEDLAAKVTKALSMPSAAATYKQKHLNLWVNTDQPWLSMEGWRKGQTTGLAREAFIDALRGRTCWAAVDLSSKIDLTSVVFVFPPAEEDPRWALVQRVFTPAETMLDRSRRDRAPYGVWCEQGWMDTTPGSRIDQGAVRDALAWGDDRFDLKEIGFDPWNAGNLPADLEADGFAHEQIVEIPQTFNHMSQPSKDFEADVLGGLIDAGDDPVLRWMAANAVVQRDGKDNMQPIKRKSRGRIDGIVAAIMARKLADTGGSGSEPAFQMFVVGGGR